MSVRNYHSTLRNIPEERRSHLNLRQKPEFMHRLTTTFYSVSLKLILIISYNPSVHLRSSLFTSRFQTLNKCSCFPMRATYSSHYKLSYLIILTLSGVKQKLSVSLLCIILHRFSPLVPSILLSTLYSGPQYSIHE